MKYSEIFIKQWKTLLTDFQVNLKKRKDAGLLPEKLDEWYQLNISRWESSIETEGVILHQQDNNDLIDEVITQMKAFQFKKVDIAFDNQPKIIGAIIILAGIALGVIECLVLSIPLAIKIIIAVIVVGLASISALKEIQSGKEKVYENVRKEYLEQLKSEGEKIAELCKKYD